MATLLYPKLWRRRAWRGLVPLCCVVLMLGQGSPALAAAPAVPAASEEGDGESSAPSRDDDNDDDEARLDSPCQAHRRLSLRRPLPGVTRTNRRAQMPHNHDGQTGAAPPVCTPFERGVALLPLRC
jgi:hypothetical protein